MTTYLTSLASSVTCLVPINMGGSLKILGVASPTLAGDAANKSYVDSAVVSNDTTQFYLSGMHAFTTGSLCKAVLSMSGTTLTVTPELRAPEPFIGDITNIYCDVNVWQTSALLNGNASMSLTSSVGFRKYNSAAFTMLNVSPGNSATIRFSCYVVSSQLDVGTGLYVVVQRVVPIGRYVFIVPAVGSQLTVTF
jgi:hypothetical protein